MILGLVIIGVFILFVFSKMPDSNDKSSSKNIGVIFKKLVKNSRYSQGVIAQIFYVGAQIMCWTYIYQYSEGIGIDNVTAGYYQMAAFILFVVGRAVATFLFRFFNPGKLLMIFALFAIVASLGVMLIDNYMGLYCLVTVSLFMSLMFPTIYGIALGDLSEEESKIGSAGLVMAIVGGALMPKFQGMIIDIGCLLYTSDAADIA